MGGIWCGPCNMMHDVIGCNFISYIIMPSYVTNKVDSSLMQNVDLFILVRSLLWCSLVEPNLLA